MPDFDLTLRSARDLTLRSAREFARHSLHRLGLRKTIDPRVTGSLAERFTGIYEQGLWSEGLDNVPGSGAGSTLDATRTLRSRLPALLTELQVTSLLDVGCGDMHWMSQVELPCPYLGIDIVASVIDRNIAQYGSDDRCFAVANAVADALPAADAVLCREVIFHLAFADSRALLRNIVATGCRWVMLTSDRATLFNADIESGGARILNLEIAPFRLEPPKHVIEDAENFRGRRIGVWSADQIAKAFS